ncbi:PREDICTED: uncharacterized protein LOC109238903 [Nicotiana attenuata]|uniref:uncharacterized protein LOC109238903 n=1 Tax=Nicotiana attenuata TaxID=49451 RepID=UPI0009055656|nr:PREDICTED: uncharacterized protein LOC109238903 [Nicotiana attenuata]
MPFAERWNFNPIAWAPYAVPYLEDWVRKLAATSSYDERKWCELLKGQWEAKNHGLGDASEMRPDPPGEGTKPSVPKSEKDNKRKRVSKPEDPEDKKTPARRLRKRSAQTGADLAHCSPDDKENDGEELALVSRATKPIKAANPSEPDTSSCGEGTPKKDAGKAPVSPEVEIVPPLSTNIPEGANAETSEANENASSGKLGAMTKGVDDTVDFNDASTLFEEAQHLLSRAELKKFSGEEKAPRLFCSQKEEELRDLRAELAKAQKNEAELDEQITVILLGYNLLGPISEANTLISQLQQKLAKKIEELEAELTRAQAEAVQAKAKAEKTKAAADKSITMYVRDVAAVQAELREASDREKQSNELAKCQARRETLEEIHARGSNLAEEIAEDVASGSGDVEGEEDVPEGEETPEDRAAEGAVPEDGAPGDMTSKID